MDGLLQDIMLSQCLDCFFRLIQINKISVIELKQQMQEQNRSSLEAVNPLIKLIKERQDLYFQLLSFLNKNIQSSSNDLDNLTIFNKFLYTLKNKANLLRQRQISFLKQFQDIFNQTDNKQQQSNRQMLRLSSRLIQILQASITKTRKSIFDQNGKSNKQFNRFKIMLHKILKRQNFVIKDYVEYIVGYCYNKYNKQVLKVEKYVEKIEDGENIYLRELYYKERSDVEVSPDKKQTDVKPKVVEKKIEMAEHLSSTQQHQKKVSLKKTVRSSLKKRQKQRRPTRIKDDKQPQQGSQSPQPHTPRKQPTVNKLLKFYSLLQLNKKQFIQDYIYTQLQKQKHKAQLYSKLIQRNKDINKQIHCFVKKSSNYILPSPNLLIIPNLNRSSDQDKDKDKIMDRNQSISSKRSLRTSFIITKKKSNFGFQSGSSGTEKVDTQSNFLEQTIKNINPRRRTSHSNNNTRVPIQKSKKLFVVKAPMLFQQQIIPQAKMTQTNWLQPSQTIKGKQKKNQNNIRLKRKNNINPLQNTFLQQNFRYPF